MRKRFKEKIISVVLLIAMLCITITPMNTLAISRSDVESKLNSLMDQYVGTTWNDYYYGTQCKGFANLIFYKLFDVVHIGAYENTDKYYIPNPSGASEVGRLSFSEMTEADAKALLQKGKPGDFIQVRRRNKTYGHSMILVGQDSSGITVFDCNSDGNNGVRSYYITWNSFYQSNSAMSLYHANNYEEDDETIWNNQSPLDLGTNFYSYITNPVSGKYVTNENGSVIGQDANGSDAQIWKFERQEDCSYKIVSELDQQALDVTDYANGGAGTKLQVSTNWDTTAQKYYIYGEEGSYYLKPLCTDMMVAMSQTTYNLEMWGMGDDYLPWQFKIQKIDMNGMLPVDLGSDLITYISNPASGQYITNIESCVSGRVQGKTADGTTSQKWKLVRQDDCSYKIISEVDGLALDVTDYASAGAGTSLQMSTSWDTTAQKYYIYGVQGAYYIKPLCTDMMVAMSQTSYNLEMWGMGDDYLPWQFSIVECKNLQYTVNYNANGGTSAPASQTKKDGITLKLSSSKPTKSYKVIYNANGGTVNSSSKNVSCEFLNWNTNQNGTGTKYNVGASYTANKDIVLYAQWSNPVAGELTIPSRSGYTFDGWYTSLENGTQVTNTSVIDSNITLYAHWTKETIESADKNTPTVSLTNSTAKVGETVDIYVNIKNNPGIVGATLSVEYDISKLKLISCNDLGILSDFQASDLSKNPFLMNWEDPLAEQNNKTDGNIAKLQFKVLDAPGEEGIEIKLSIDTIYDVNIEDVNFSTVNGFIIQNTYTPGDVNNDGTINSKDSILLRKYILGANVTINLDAADVNKDGNINSKDSILLRKYILGANVELK